VYSWRRRAIDNWSKRIKERKIVEVEDADADIQHKWWSW
jgi:hypothetical protein